MASKPCEHCGSSDAMQEYADGSYCFSCNKKTFNKSDVQKEYKHILYDIEDVEPFPVEILAWLYKYRFTDENIKRFGFWYRSRTELWSPNKNAWYEVEKVLCMPVHADDGKVEGVVCRNFADWGPKVFSQVKPNAIWKSNFTKTKYRVITEDIISGARVAGLIPSLSLLGTNIPSKVGLNDKLKRVLASADTLIMWLDGDEPGQKAAKKLINTIQQYKKCVNIVTNKDPKCYSNSEIANILRNQANIVL